MHLPHYLHLKVHHCSETTGGIIERWFTWFRCLLNVTEPDDVLNVGSDDDLLP